MPDKKDDKVMLRVLIRRITAQQAARELDENQALWALREVCCNFLGLPNDNGQLL